MLPSDIVVHVEAPRQGLRVQADPTQLLQIMMNLSVNAKDAMPEGGKLTFRLTPLTESNEAQIEVTDTGTGIPKEEMKQIFEPFYTTKLAGKGTGLGLANVQRLVQEMGGRIEVESARGQGASFTIRLPLTDAKVLAPVPHEVELTKGTGSILVLDDDVRVRAFVFTALGKMGYHVYEASRLSAALELAKAHPAELALFLTDVVMEGGGGAAAIAAIRSEISDVPVLVMSGYTNDEALRRGISSGKFPFLPKPFTAEQLGVAVREAISKRQVREPKGAP
jgi:CheY-like chemotaxis protein